LITRQQSCNDPATVAALCRANVKLVAWVWKQIRDSELFDGVDPHVAISAGFRGLWRAAQHYDPTKGVKFSPYAVFAIRHKMVQSAYRRQLDRRTVRVSEMGREGGNPYPVAAPGHGPVATVLRAEEVGRARRRVRTVLENLRPSHRRALRMVHLQGMTQAQAADALGVSRARVHQLCRAALRAARRWVERHRGLYKE